MAYLCLGFCRKELLRLFLVCLPRKLFLEINTNSSPKIKMTLKPIFVIQQHFQIMLLRNITD